MSLSLFCVTLPRLVVQLRADNNKTWKYRINVLLTDVELRILHENQMPAPRQTCKNTDDGTCPMACTFHEKQMPPPWIIGAFDLHMVAN